MKNRVIAILLVSSFAMVRFVFSATAETEPNNLINDSGVQTITATGTYTGMLVASTDNCDIWKIYFPSQGDIEIYFSVSPTNDAFYLDLYESVGGYSCGFPDTDGIRYCGSGGSFTYTLQSNRYYCLSAAAWAPGNWGNYSFTIYGDASLPVELVSFRASYETINGITLDWVTESEVDNLGFNIYRSLNPNKQFTKINDQLIPGAGSSSQKHKYEYVDKDVTNGVTYWYKLEDVDYSGNTELHGPISATPVAKAAPTEFCFYPNHPNPFNISTTLSYQLPKSSFVQLSIYDINGRLVETLVCEHKNAGYYSVEWNANNVGSGIYFYKIDAGEFSSVRKCLVVK